MGKPTFGPRLNANSREWGGRKGVSTLGLGPHLSSEGPSLLASATERGSLSAHERIR